MPRSVTAGVGGCHQGHSQLIPGKWGLKISDDGDDREIQRPIPRFKESSIYSVLVPELIDFFIRA